MLKTLKITSLIALIAAVGGVIVIAVFGLRGDAEILAFLGNPGVVEKAKEKIQPDDDSKEVESPLVSQLKAFALRIDPPPPPKPKDPPKPKAPEKPKPELVREAPKPKSTAPPRPKAAVNAKFTLLATVQCPGDPTRSMALLQQTGGKQEWFRQGERVGHLDVQEVRDGSVIFSQGGDNSQELFVPEKPKVKSILRNDNQAVSKGGPGSINVQIGDETKTADADTTVSGIQLPIDVPGQIEAGQQTSQATTEVTDSGRLRLQRRRSEAPNAAQRTDRVRTRVAPRVRTPQEQKASIESNISSIQEIMQRDTTSDPDQKQKENEAWMKLLKALESEKQSIDKNVEKASEAKKSSSQSDQTEAEDPNSN